MGQTLKAAQTCPPQTRRANRMNLTSKIVGGTAALLAAAGIAVAATSGNDTAEVRITPAANETVVTTLETTPETVPEPAAEVPTVEEPAPAVPAPAPAVPAPTVEEPAAPAPAPEPSAPSLPPAEDPEDDSGAGPGNGNNLP